MILNCVVIDDDPEALNQITSHIKRTPTLQLIGAYTSAREAVRDVRNGHVDVLYLAIQMPELSGIEFARLVPESCRLVFTHSLQGVCLRRYQGWSCRLSAQAHQLRRLSGVVQASEGYL